MDPADGVAMSVLALRRTACMELCGQQHLAIAVQVYYSDTDVNKSPAIMPKQCA
jgi:hypothetical protein